ncbi:DUF4389 domain-containing protein [Alkalimarinus coralli]|uniref:DUF4389 domain-containing protein n=1 Tax=Alkalimarinus coralli TaxID=2935863 RepID=UPI00202B57A5|nr:DUF4389 domain-containing protein [Alkalimarinus coralli]
MSDNREYDKEAHWLRIIYMIGFYVVYKIIDLLIIVMLILQAVVTTFGTGPNQRLTEFGASLATYVSQIIRFLSYADEKKPYPFSEWPKGK